MIKKVYHSRIAYKLGWMILGIVVTAVIGASYGSFQFVVKIVGALLILLSLFTVILNFAAILAKQSTSSLILDKLLRFFPKKDRSNQEYVEEAMRESSQPYVLPEKIRMKYNIHEYNELSDTFVIDHSKSDNKLVIFYLHGGGYWVQPVSLHYMFFNKIAKALNGKLILPIYPLAPANTATAVHEMVLDRYLRLLDDGISNDDIVFMGDSAGAGLSLALMQQLRDKKLPLPRKAILLSPWVDVTNSTQGIKEVHDPFDNVDNLTYGGKIYAGKLDPKNPLVSPIYGSLKNLPPIVMFSGTYDALNVDVEKMANSTLSKKNIDLTLYLYPKMVHGFSGFFFTPEAKDSFEKIVQVIKS